MIRLEGRLRVALVLALLLAPAHAAAEILLPPGFTAQVYVTGEGFQARASEPSSVLRDFDACSQSASLGARNRGEKAGGGSFGPRDLKEWGRELDAALWEGAKIRESLHDHDPGAQDYPVHGEVL